METSFFCTASGDRLAYVRQEGTGPVVMFLGGFRSDMTGTKAMALEAWAKEHGRGYLRFDYHGHGQSSGDFADGTIGRWADNAMELMQTVTQGKLLLVGSSMGGWIMLLVARALGERVAGLVGIAAAPDFTEELMWANWDEETRREIMEKGMIPVPSDYGEPYPITRALIEDGRRQCVLRQPLPITCPVRLLHGMADVDVPWQVSLRLAEHIESRNTQVHLVKEGDHRMSSPEQLALLVEALEAMSQGYRP